MQSLCLSDSSCLIKASNQVYMGRVLSSISPIPPSPFSTFSMAKTNKNSTSTIANANELFVRKKVPSGDPALGPSW